MHFPGEGAHNALLDLEELDEERLRRGRLDTGSPDLKQPTRARQPKGA